MNKNLEHNSWREGAVTMICPLESERESHRKRPLLSFLRPLLGFLFPRPLLVTTCESLLFPSDTTLGRLLSICGGPLQGQILQIKAKD